MCTTHYSRYYRNGGAVDVRPRSRSLEERFWSKVDKSAGPGECWGWTATTADGYGYIRDGSASRRAHRVSYELHHGPIPAGMTVDHNYAAGCRSRACTNPAHLRLLTASENSREAAMRREYHPGDTCKRGHRDWAIAKAGHRYCRTCQRDARQRWEADHREERSAAALARYHANKA